jgi:hypothetical protein
MSELGQLMNILSNATIVVGNDVTPSNATIVVRNDVTPSDDISDDSSDDIEDEANYDRRDLVRHFDSIGGVPAVKHILSNPNTPNMWFMAAFIYDKDIIKGIYTHDDMNIAMTRANDEVSNNPLHIDIKQPQLQYFKYIIAVAEHLYKLTEAHSKEALLASFKEWKLTNTHITVDQLATKYKHGKTTMGCGVDVKDGGDICIIANIDSESTICPVCYDTLGNPKQGVIITCGNGHNVCQQCIVKSDNLRCPVCRDIFIVMNNSLTEIFHSITSVCVNEGCDHHTMKHKMVDHMKSCEHAPVPCKRCDKHVYNSEYIQHIRDRCSGQTHIEPNLPFPNLTFIIMKLIDQCCVENKKDRDEEHKHATDVMVSYELIPNKLVLFIASDGDTATFSVCSVPNYKHAQKDIVFEFITKNAKSPGLSSVQRMVVPIFPIGGDTKTVQVNHSEFNGNVLFSDRDNKYCPVRSRSIWYVRNIDKRWKLGKIVNIPKYDLYEPTITVAYDKQLSNTNETMVLNTATNQRFRSHSDPPLSIRIAELQWLF